MEQELLDLAENPHEIKEDKERPFYIWKFYWTLSNTNLKFIEDLEKSLIE